MRRRINVWAGAIVLLAVGIACAQDSSTPLTDASGQTGQQQGPVPAYGHEDTPITTSENPPLSGIDLPSLEPNAAPLSYLQPGGTFTETADSNAASLIGGGSDFSSITRGLGSLALRRLWSHYDLALDYVGGVAYYSLHGQGAKLLQQMDVGQKITWRRGALSLRDSFSYLPEGNFGSSYGSLGSAGTGSLGNSSFGAFFGGSALGTFGLAPRIVNVSLVDIQESLTPKTTVTAAGAYAFTHFLDNEVSTGTPFLGVKQISAQAGLDHLLSARTQVALEYRYQGFDYSIAGMAFHSQIIQAMYGHRITGRMDFLIAAGPQLTRVDSHSAVCADLTLPPNVICELSGNAILPVTTRETRLGVAGEARLRYKFPRTSLGLIYQRYVTGGSGLFAGSQSDIARLTVTRPLSRVWSMFADIGYTRNSRIQQLSAQELATCVYSGQQNPLGLPLCPGVNANHNHDEFIGAGLHRQFGHDFHGFASYQFNRLVFDNSYCVGLPNCSRSSNRHAITFGLDWTPRPIRLD
jgi:hypothetical protein